MNDYNKKIRENWGKKHPIIEPDIILILKKILKKKFNSKNENQNNQLIYSIDDCLFYPFFFGDCTMQSVVIDVFQIFPFLLSFTFN